MNALLKRISIRPLIRPTYGRYDLVRDNDFDGWRLENRELLQGWFNDTAQYADEMEPFDSFARGQFDIERDQYEQLKADAIGYDDYITREDE